MESWYVNDKFNDENVKISKDVKLYIDDLIKKTIENKNVQLNISNKQLNQLNET